MKLAFAVLIASFFALGLAAAKEKSMEKSSVQKSSAEKSSAEKSRAEKSSAQKSNAEKSSVQKSSAEKSSSPNVNSPCIYNSTHCSCAVSAKPGTCLRKTSGEDNRATCVVDSCQGGGYACDCDGPSICKLETCSNFYPSDSTPASEHKQGSFIACSLRDSNMCLTHISDTSEPAPAQKYKMVQFGDASAANMFNMGILTDRDDFIQKTGFEMGDKWDNHNMLQSRYITMRLYRGDGADNIMLCAIYNTYGQPDDNLGNMSIDVKVKGLASQKLKFVACDDASECPTKAESVLSAKHVLNAKHSDGWCVAPLTRDGNGISVKFENVEKFKGVTFTHGDGPMRDFVFKGGEGGLYGKVDKDGLVTEGEMPEIIFNIGSIAVPKTALAT